MRGSISDLQATSTAGRVGGVQRPDVDYNLRLASPRPVLPSQNNPPLTKPGGIPSVPNGTLPNQGLQFPNATRVATTVGQLGGASGSGLPISAQESQWAQ